MMESEHKQDARMLIFGRGAVRRARATLSDAMRRSSADKALPALSPAERFFTLFREAEPVGAAALMMIASTIAEHADKAGGPLVSPARLPEARSLVSSATSDAYRAAERITGIMERLAREFPRKGKLAAQRFLNLAAKDRTIAEDALRSVALSAGSA